MKPFLIGLLCLLSSIAPAVADELKPFGGGTAPALRLMDLDGKLHDLKDYRGKVVMVQFWATYCPPCLKEMPSMVRLESKLAGKPFVILAVNMGESEKEVKDFFTKMKTDFTVLMDSDGRALADWKVFVAPSSFLIDTRGAIRYTLQGGAEWDAPEFVTKISGMLPPK